MLKRRNRDLVVPFQNVPDEQSTFFFFAQDLERVKVLVLSKKKRGWYSLITPFTYYIFP